MKMITAIVFAAISVFFISCDRETSTDTSTTETPKNDSEKFTITHMADDSEDVFITLGGSSQMEELSPGQCVSFSRGDFEYLNVKVGLGFMNFGNIDLCGGEKGKCVSGNYTIEDKGGFLDDYQLILVEEPNPDCPETIK